MIALLLPLLLQTAPAAAKPAGPPVWTYRENKDPTGVVKGASATMRSEDGTARLVVRCDMVDVPLVTVQFLPKPPLAAGNPRNVTLVLDNAKAEISVWELPGMGAFIVDPVETFTIIGELASSKTIDLALADDAGNTQGGRFAGAAGNDEMFRKVYAACGAPYAPLQPAQPAKKSK